MFLSPVLTRGAITAPPPRGRFLEGESFVRRGAAGGWREEFTEEMEEQFQAWLDTKGCNIPFHWS